MLEMLRRLSQNLRDLFFKGKTKIDKYIFSPYATREEIGLSTDGSSPKHAQGREKNNKLNYGDSDYVDLKTIRAKKADERLKKATPAVFKKSQIFIIK